MNTFLHLFFSLLGTHYSPSFIIISFNIKTGCSKLKE